MIYLSESWVIPWLSLLAEWSVRWGIVIAVLAAWLTLRPPRSAAIRHLLCLAVLAAGLFLPVGPRWGDANIFWLSRSLRAGDGSAPSVPRPTTAQRSRETPVVSQALAKPESQNRVGDALPRSTTARGAADPQSLGAATASLGAWRLAALMATGVWAAVVLALVLRLAGGWLTLAQLRREAVEVSCDSARLLDASRAALGLSRPVRLAVHSAVVSPVVVAGPRPVVLVPPDWFDWPESQRRACLVHELAHLARYDDWTKLAQELLRIPFFFHPLVRWLLTRIDLERELLGDEAAVALGSDPVGYAQLLLELARRPGRLVPVIASNRHGVLPFLDRTTVEVRIKRLLEEDMRSTISCPSAGRYILVGGLILATALVIGGLRVRNRAASLAVSPISVRETLALRGRLVDATGAPIAGATLIGIREGRMFRPILGTDTATDARGEFGGEFQLPPVLKSTVVVGNRLRLLIRLRDGSEHEISFILTNGSGLVLKLPVDVNAPGGASGPRDVTAGELAGVVVDADGKPIAGAQADVWTWFAGNEATTDSAGSFRISGLDQRSQDPKVEVVVRKEGYTPHFFLAQPTGQPGWVIVLRKKTYFEGCVTGPDGKPVAGARIRANCGPKLTAGEVWTEATSGEDGRYRMYVHPDVYDVQVRAPGVGVARLPETAVGLDEAKLLDIRLEPGLTFRAKLVDSLSGDPVPGVRLRALYNQPGIEGQSNRDGVVEISGMMPGRFMFQVDAPAYARWWSDEAETVWNRRTVPAINGGWQRNFDDVDFDLTDGMAQVTITVERGVTVAGRVVDPDGKPVAGATVDAALTGTGNSLTGDARFGVETDRDGRFKATLPASGVHEYNLVAHDGKYRQWRTWANGVLPPIQTQPGDSLHDVEIRLTRPAIVRGRVTDADGHPVAKREVRASAADQLENRYYDPTVTTADDGSYELRFIRPGKHFIQVAPFWLNARQAPAGTSREVVLTPDESKDGVDFQLPRGQGPA